MSHLLKYGRNSGKIVSISDVVSGLACNCTCPSCGRALIAKKGKKREHHFAHYGSTDCNYGCESALHIMAKSILAETKQIFVPGETSIREGSVRSFSDVVLESQEFSDIVPDVLLKNSTDRLCVEILVTHAIDAAKREKIENAKLPTIEVDLSNMIESYDEASVRECLLNGSSTKWIFNKTIEEQQRRQNLALSLCDHLPSIKGKDYEQYDCPMLNKRVSFLYGSHSCHECSYYEHDLSVGSARPCSYRERNMPKAQITDCKDVLRKDGKIISIYVFTEGIWQYWSGDSGSVLSQSDEKSITEPAERSPHSKTAPEGHTVSDLWKKEYSGIAIYNQEKHIEMLISGKNGEMHRNRSGEIIGRYRYKADGRYADNGKDYTVRDPDKPIWKLQKSFFQNESRAASQSGVAAEQTPSQNSVSSASHQMLPYSRIDPHHKASSESSEAALEKERKRIEASFDPLSKKPILDRFKNRWRQCVTCKQFKMDSDMAAYGGSEYGPNQGLCAKCSRQLK